MMQDVQVKLYPVLPGQQQYSTTSIFFHQQSGIKFQEETSKVLHLEHNFVGTLQKVYLKYQENFGMCCW